MARSAVAWLRNDLRLHDNERRGKLGGAVVHLQRFRCDPFVDLFFNPRFRLSAFNERILKEEQADKFALNLDIHIIEIQ